jgi:hypothetical protein
MTVWEWEDFFGLFNHISRNKSDQIFFLDLALLSRASPVGTTHEGVTTCALTWLSGETRAGGVDVASRRLDSWQVV